MALIGAKYRGYSGVVGVLKLVLPLTALVLLSLVFLLAETIDPMRGISSAGIDVADRARDPRLSGARYAGVTADGAALTINAQTARTDPNAVLRLDIQGLELSVSGGEGEGLRARAEQGELDRAGQTFDMSGGIEISAAPGYLLNTDRLTGSLEQTRIEAPGRVHGQAPAGDIEAGNLTLIADSASETGYRLVFGGGVRLLYQP